MILIGRWSDSRLMSQRPNWIASGMSVAEHLMSCPRLVASTAAELELRSGLVNPELLGLLTNAVDRFTLEVKVIKSGHPMGPVSPAGRVNSHYFYCAADIYSVNGETVAARPIPAGANLPISGQWRIAQPQTRSVPPVKRYSHSRWFDHLLVCGRGRPGIRCLVAGSRDSLRTDCFVLREAWSWHAEWC